MISLISALVTPLSRARCRWPTSCRSRPRAISVATTMRLRSRFFRPGRSHTSPNSTVSLYLIRSGTTSRTASRAEVADDWAMISSALSGLVNGAQTLARHAGRTTRDYPHPALPRLRGRVPRASEEEGQVLAQQHVLVEDDLAPRDPPIDGAVGSPQHVFALADQDVGLGLDTVAVDQEAASDRHFARR